MSSIQTATYGRLPPKPSNRASSRLTVSSNAGFQRALFGGIERRQHAGWCGRPRFERVPRGTLDAPAVSLDEQVLDLWHRGGERLALVRPEHRERSRQRARGRRVGGDDGGAHDVSRGPAGARVDDVRVVTAVDLDPAAVAAARRHGTIAHGEARQRLAVLGVVRGIGHRHGLGPVPADDEIAADVDHDARDAVDRQGGARRAVEDVALGERAQHERNIGEVRGAAIRGPQAPVGLLNGEHGGRDLRVGRQAPPRRRRLPDARRGFSRRVERAGGARAPGIEEVQHFEELGRHRDGDVPGAEPAAELARRVVRAQDPGLAVDLGERGRLGARGRPRLSSRPPSARATCRGSARD